MGLKRTVEPVADAITIHTAKKACEIGTSDTTHDAHLQRLIAGAVRDVERFTRRALITQTWELTLSGFCHWRIPLPRPELQSVSSIEYVDDAGTTQTLSPSLYQVSSGDSPGFVEPAHNEVWPSTRPSTVDAVTITYVAGFGNGSTKIPAEYANLLAELVVFRFTAGRGDMQVDIPKHIKWSLESLKCGAVLGYYGVKQ
jgi:uncharacterized phiE125 gp8 family phage protein